MLRFKGCKTEARLHFRTKRCCYRERETTDIHGAIDAVWKIESARLIASLTRIVRDVGIAEDLAQEALVVALEQWPARAFPTTLARG